MYYLKRLEQAISFHIFQLYVNFRVLFTNLFGFSASASQTGEKAIAKS